MNGLNFALSGRTPRVYAQADFDGSDDTLPLLPNFPVPPGPGVGGNATGPFQLPAPGPTHYNSCPLFPAGYNNGTQAERTNHPLLYDPIWPGLPLYPNSANSRFPASNLVSLYNKSVLGSTNLNCNLGKLLPNNMSSPRIPWMITTDSYHLDRAGLTPWLWDRTVAAAQQTSTFYGYGQAYVGGGGPLPAQDPDLAPTGQAVPFPALANRIQNGGGVPGAASQDSEFRSPGQPNYLPSPPAPPNTLNTAVDWRAIDAALSKVNLNRFLPPYPHQGQGTNAAPYNKVSNPNGYQPVPLTATPNDRFDDPNAPNAAAISNQFVAAHQARQKMANDIYRRLLLVTGVPGVALTDQPTPGELAPRRWLAQLAVNIVDFIDEDEISTPFNFYQPSDAYPNGVIPPNPNYKIDALSANPSTGNPADPELPKYWVCGTELPKVVVNEVLAEYQSQVAPGAVTVNLFVELFNPMPSAAQLPGGNYPGTVQPQDNLPIPLYYAKSGIAPAYSPYRLVIANTNTTAGPVPGSRQRGSLALAEPQRQRPRHAGPGAQQPEPTAFRSGPNQAT